MQVSLEQLAKDLIGKSVTNIRLISYFKRSSVKTPVFLSVINRNYAEIKPLLNNDLVQDLEPVNSYVFFIDKLENFFYQQYQEKIDIMIDEIHKRKRKKADLVKFTEEMEPDENSEDYEEKLQACLEYAREAISQLDKMEVEKEDLNIDVGKLQNDMKCDPMYKLLFYIRNDKEIVFNKRTEDNERKIRTKLLQYSNVCVPDNAGFLFAELRNKGIFKEYSPAKNYYITELGLMVDEKLKTLEWAQEEGDYEKNAEEIAQDAEFNRLKEHINF